jgi:hypothetical protein
MLGWESTGASVPGGFKFCKIELETPSDVSTLSLQSSNLKMSSTKSLSLLDCSNDPVYGDIYQILQRNYLGSWGDACFLYDQIRRDAIWTELTGLITARPTKTAAQRAQELLEELKNVDNSSMPKAESVVRTWAPPAKAKTAASTAKAPTNAFATLCEDSDEE